MDRDAGGWMLVHVRIIGCNLPGRAMTSVSPHRHPHVEWHYAVAGACGFAVGRREVDLRSGDLLMVPPGSEHRLRIRRSGEWLVQIILASVDEDAADAELREAFRRRAGRAGAVAAGGDRHALIAGIARDQAAADPLRRRGASLRFAAMLCDLVAGDEPGGHPAVARALAVMRANPGRRLGLAEIVAAAGCGRSLLMRRFRAEVGEPPLAHHLGLRLDRAAELLRDPERRVGAAAAAAGFDDPYHFSRCFRRRFGRPPSAR